MSIKPSRILTQCPLCHTSYEEPQIRLLGARGPSQLFHCSCLSCGHSVLAIVLQNSGWVSSVGVVTDLEITDALRFHSAKPITTDECIELHKKLFSESRELCADLLLAASKKIA